jgi:hypothetical protein
MIPLAMKAEPSTENLVKHFRREFEKFLSQTANPNFENRGWQREACKFHKNKNVHIRSGQNCLQ